MSVLVALLFYDYLLTFGDEVNCVWRRRLSTATVIYLLMRYPPFLSQALLLIHFVVWSNAALDRAALMWVCVAGYKCAKSTVSDVLSRSDWT